MNIDLKDRKILYQLDQNSRQTLSRLGKKVGLHENGVAYRLNRLEKQGIIKNYYTVVDAYKLGYLPVRFYLKFQFTSPDIEERIIQYFKNNEQTWWIVTLEGKYDYTAYCDYIINIIAILVNFLLIYILLPTNRVKD